MRMRVSHLIALVSLLIITHSALAQTTRPNFLFIITDDQRFDTMSVVQKEQGEKARFWIPSSLAYGENPRPGAPAGDLVFDIELIAVQ